MKAQNGSLPREETRLKSEEGGSAESTPREAEQDDVAEPDAPTSAQENAGMSTVLDAEPLSGVQDDGSDQ